MPFDFLKRLTGKAPEAGREAGQSISFDGLTEEWRLVGRMEVAGRLSDVLNRREQIPISEVSWGPADGSTPLAAAPGLRSVDPYDLIVVFADASSLPQMTEEERAAHKVHKVPWDLVLEAPPFRVEGTVHLFPGSDPGRLMERGTEMFVAVTGATAWLGDRKVSEAVVDTVLLNRRYLRGVRQVEKRKGKRPGNLPDRRLPAD